MVRKDGSIDHSNVLTDSRDASHPAAFLAAFACLVWYLGVLLVSAVGCTQLWRYYSSSRPRSKASSSPDPPHVSIIRPVKGLEPYLYECLASTFRQDYKPAQLTVFFCISDVNDPALPTLKQLLKDFPTFNARILIETEDGHVQRASMGPNPKIRNMSRAYREAKGDIVWIIDCNVWVGRGTLGRMVDTLQGESSRPAKFVHVLPLVVDVTDEQSSGENEALLSNGSTPATLPSSSNIEGHQTRPASDQLNKWQYGGGRLEELFMSSAHAKFYTAINTVLIAPCIVGKSTMFRRSHLNGITDGKGIDYFSKNICEDHLIGDLLWKRKVPEQLAGEHWQNHAMVFGDLAIQPMAAMSVVEYMSRRVRWLRVRKFTVSLATFVEPGTESFLCSLYGAFAMTSLGFLPCTWTAFWLFWLLSVSAWCAVDRTLYQILNSGQSVDVDEDTPSFSRPPRSGTRRPFGEWLMAWIGREALALPIWSWAVYGGVTVTWRGKKFWVGIDMKVHELAEQTKSRQD